MIGVLTSLSSRSFNKGKEQAEALLKKENLMEYPELCEAVLSHAPTSLEEMPFILQHFKDLIKERFNTDVDVRENIVAQIKGQKNKNILFAFDEMRKQGILDEPDLRQAIINNPLSLFHGKIAAFILLKAEGIHTERDLCQAVFSHFFLSIEAKSVCDEVSAIRKFLQENKQDIGPEGRQVILNCIRQNGIFPLRKAIQALESLKEEKSYGLDVNKFIFNNIDGHYTNSIIDNVQRVKDIFSKIKEHKLETDSELRHVILGLKPVTTVELNCRFENSYIQDKSRKLGCELIRNGSVRAIEYRGLVTYFEDIVAVTHNLAAAINEISSERMQPLGLMEHREVFRATLMNSPRNAGSIYYIILEAFMKLASAKITVNAETAREIIKSASYASIFADNIIRINQFSNENTICLSPEEQNTLFKDPAIAWLQINKWMTDSSEMSEKEQRAIPYYKAAIKYLDKYINNSTEQKESSFTATFFNNAEEMQCNSLIAFNLKQALQSGSIIDIDTIRCRHSDVIIKSRRWQGICSLLDDSVFSPLNTPSIKKERVSSCKMR